MVGWLSKDHPFSKGQVSPLFLDKLEALCENPIMLHRGFHVCEFCNAKEIDIGNWAKLGNGHIKVPINKISSYWAPTMIHHYVSAHQYLPPRGLISAVESL